MAKASYIARVLRLDKEHPGLRRSLDDLLANEPKHQHTIACRINQQYNADIADEEVVGYAQERGGRMRIKIDLSRAQSAEPGLGDPPQGDEAVVLNPEAGAVQNALDSPQAAHQAIVSWAQQYVAEIFLAAKVDPNTTAAKMMHILLLSGLVNSKKNVEEVETEKLLSETARREDAELKLKRLSTERFNAETRRVLADQQADKLKFEVKRLQAQTKAITSDLKERLDAIRERAERAKDHGRPFDYDRALKQISAVIGVGRPLVERVAPQARE